MPRCGIPHCGTPLQETCQRAAMQETCHAERARWSRADNSVHGTRLAGFSHKTAFRPGFPVPCPEPRTQLSNRRSARRRLGSVMPVTRYRRGPGPQERERARECKRRARWCCTFGNVRGLALQAEQCGPDLAAGRHPPPGPGAWGPRSSAALGLSGGYGAPLRVRRGPGERDSGGKRFLD